MRCFPQAERWWSLPTGPSNTIEDVPGVSVGHTTLTDGSARTGVTAVLPHDGDLFAEPVPAGMSVLNGFGKSLGLMQLAELGEIETPILLTNTFGVPACAQALIRAAIARNGQVGRDLRTVNPLVLECNDGHVNDIQALAVTEEAAQDAIAAAEKPGFCQGTVGAGTGMRTFGLSGGIGSASRRIDLQGGSSFALGALVLSNFGQPDQLRVFGRRVRDPQPAGYAPEKGSIIMIFATDAPLDSRQLCRMSRRGGAALGRLGSFIGHQSGDIAVAFSTVRPTDGTAASGPDTLVAQRLREDRLDAFFHGAVEAAEEAVLNALWHAEGVVGYTGSKLPILRDRLDEF